MRAIKYTIIMCILTALAIVGCGRGTGEKELTHEEVRAINERVLEKAISSPDSALMMIEGLRDTLPDYRCDYLRAKVYGQSLEGMWLDSAIIIGERLMTTDAASEDLAYRQDVLEMLINACRQHHDDELTIHWSAQLIDLCRQNGDETEALRTEADLGLMLSGIGRADEGLAKIDSVLTLLSGKRKFNELDATIIALKRKVNVLKNMQTGLTPDPSPEGEGSGYLQGQKTNDTQPVGTPLAFRRGVGGEAAIIAAAQQMLDLLADYEQHPDEYHDGTYREPPEHLRPGYIDFYRAQAYMFMVEGLTSATDTSADKGNHSPLPRRGAGGEALLLFEQTNYAKTFSARKDMAPTYGLLGEYDKMLAIHDEQEARLRQQGDTVCAEYATILRDRAMAAEARGRHAEANAYHRRYEALTATLNDRLLQGKANLYAARFHAAEQQREIERGRARAGRATMLSAAFGIVALLVLLFAAYVVRQWRMTREKNRALVRQIDEGFRSKDEIEKLRETIKRLQRTQQPQPDDSVSLTTKSPATEGQGGGLSDADLFEHIRQVITTEHLYLDPQFDRQTAIDRFGLSKERIGAAFSKGSEFSSIAAFIRDCRLRHAYFMLTKHPEMGIAEIATASGYTNPSTFTTDFKRTFGLTPREHREQQKNNK